MMKAVLSNADHPEYGVVTIPLPVPRNQYDHCVALLEALEIGDASEADCRLDSLDSAWPVLNQLVCTKVNLDELDYLAKRLDSFDVGESSQFQVMDRIHPGVHEAGEEERVLPAAGQPECRGLSAAGGGGTDKAAVQHSGVPVPVPSGNCGRGKIPGSAAAGRM